MRKFLLFGLIPLIIGFGLGYTLQVYHNIEDTPVSPPEKQPLATYKQISTRLPQEFDILLPCSQFPTNLAVAVNVIDPENYYLVEFGQKIRLTRFEDGIKACLTQVKLPADLPASGDIIIKRRLRDIIISVDGQIVAEAYDGTFSRGKALLSTIQGLNVSGIKVQRVGEIFFADDFMKGAGPASEWETTSGDWNVNITEYTVRDTVVKQANTSLSSNAFYYIGTATADTIYPMRTSAPSLQTDAEYEKVDRSVSEIVGELTAKLKADAYLANLNIKTGTNLRGDKVVTVHGTVDPTSVNNFRKLALTVDGIRPYEKDEKEEQQTAVTIKSKDGQEQKMAECHLCIDSTEGLREIDEYFDTTDVALKVLECTDEQLMKELTEKTAADSDLSRYTLNITIENARATIASAPLDAADYKKLKALTETVRGLQQADFSLPALSIAGYWFWDNYSFQASCLPPLPDAGEKNSGVKAGKRPQWIGLCFYYRDPHNYFLFRWGGGSEGKKQLIEVKDSEERVIAEQSGGYKFGQWYALRVSVSRQMIKAFIDDNLIFTAHDKGLTCGKIGLYSYGQNPARFDDVFVQNETSRYETFAGSLNRWQKLGGNWRIDKSGNNTNLVVQAENSGKLITGEDDWRSYTISADVSQFTDGTIGLTARYCDEANHYSYTIQDDGIQRLTAIVYGKETVLAEKQQKLPPDARLFLSVENDLIYAGINGETLLEGWNASIQSGRTGLCAKEVDSAAFDNVSIQTIQRGEPILTTNEIFSREKTMENWASRLSDWLAASDSTDGKRYSVSWHRADFPGDVELTAKLDEPPPANAEARLVISAEKQDINSGYALAVTSADGLQLELFRNSESLAKTTATGSLPLRISFQKKGSYVIAMVNFKPVLKVKETEPLDGVIIGVAQQGVEVPLDEVQVFCPNVYAYTFDRAACDWRAAAGSWMVRNRWQCDPRWSFFSGVSEKNDDAVIWSKRIFDANNVTLEFAAGMKMDAARGNRYEYASDMNATICADGRDIMSGYSFMFGALGNSCTRIMKGEEVLAETKEDVIPNQPGKPSIHRRWFYFKIRKIGSKLEYYVDNKLVLECTDPEPLTGKRIALWTHNNGIMIAKVRMSSKNADTRESPDFEASGAPKTLYTKK